MHLNIGRSKKRVTKVMRGRQDLVRGLKKEKESAQKKGHSRIGIGKENKKLNTLCTRTKRDATSRMSAGRESQKRKKRRQRQTEKKNSKRSKQLAEGAKKQSQKVIEACSKLRRHDQFRGKKKRRTG